MIIDFHAGVSSFASDFPVWHRGVLGLVTLVLNLVVGTVRGGWFLSRMGLLLLFGELSALVGDLLTSSGLGR